MATGEAQSLRLLESKISDKVDFLVRAERRKRVLHTVLLACVAWNMYCQGYNWFSDRDVELLGLLISGGALSFFYYHMNKAQAPIPPRRYIRRLNHSLKVYRLFYSTRSHRLVQRP